MKQRPVCEIGNEGRAKGRKKVKKKKEKKRGKKIGTRWQSAGKSWMKCLSICRSIHARCTTEKYGDLFSSRFSIYTRKWETTRGLPNIRHSAIFLSLFFRCMNLSGEGRGGEESFTGAGYLRCIRRASTFVDMIFLPILRADADPFIKIYFIFTHDAGSCNKIRILQMNNWYYGIGQINDANEIGNGN